jgi:hypothetical protein
MRFSWHVVCRIGDELVARVPVLRRQSAGPRAAAVREKSSLHGGIKTRETS